MAISRIGGATPVYSTTTSATTPTVTRAVGDLLILVVGMKPDTGTITTPTGYTSIGTTTGGTGTTGTDAGPMKLALYSRIATNTSADLPSITSSGANVWVVDLQVFRSSTGATLEMAYVGAPDTTGGTPNLATMPSNPGLTVGDMLLAVSIIPTDVTTPAQFTAQQVSATGMTTVSLTEHAEYDTTSGNDMGGWIASGLVVTGTSTASPVITATVAGTTTNVYGPMGLLRIREAAPSNVDVSASDTLTLIFDDSAEVQSSGGAGIGDPVSGAAAESTGGTIAIEYPPSPVSGDLLILVVQTGSVSFPDLPSGWTLIANATSGTSQSPAQMVAYKWATGSESGSLSVSIPSANAKGRMSKVGGVDPTNPIDASPTTASFGATTAYTNPGVTTTVADTLLLLYTESNSTNGSFTSPTTQGGGWVESVDFTGTTIPHIAAHRLKWSGSGATGDVNLVRSGGVRGNNILVALRPASTGPNLVSASESNSLAVSEETSISIAITASDSVAVSVGEAATNSVSLTTTDTSAISITETRAVAVTRTTTDTASLSIADSGTISANISVPASDTASLIVSESAAIAVARTATDAVSLAIADTASLFKQVVATDSVSITVSDISNASSSMPGTESTALAITETRSIAVSLTSTDSAALTITDAGFQGTSFVGSESTALGVTESAALAKSSAGSEAVAIAVTESSAVQKTIGTTDTFALAITESTTLANSRATADTVGLSVSETASIAAVVTASDTAALAHTSVVSSSGNAPGQISTAIGVTEQASIVVSVSANNTAAISVSETKTTTVSRSTTDTAALTITESRIVQNTKVGTDTSAITITESSSVQQVTGGTHPYVHTGGLWKAGIFYIYEDAQWKEIQPFYRKTTEWE